MKVEEKTIESECNENLMKDYAEYEKSIEGVFIVNVSEWEDEAEGMAVSGNAAVSEDVVVFECGSSPWVWIGRCGPDDTPQSSGLS